MIGRCEPEDVIANRLDPWHGAWLHPYSFAELTVLSAPPVDCPPAEDRFLVEVIFTLGRRVGVPVRAAFTCPDPRTVTMEIVDGEGAGSVVETHATPLRRGPDGQPRTAVVEAVIAHSDRSGFAHSRRVAAALRPLMGMAARRLWRDDIAYAERRYVVRTRSGSGGRGPGGEQHGQPEHDAGGQPGRAQPLAEQQRGEHRAGQRLEQREHRPGTGRGGPQPTEVTGVGDRRRHQGQRHQQQCGPGVQRQAPAGGGRDDRHQRQPAQGEADAGRGDVVQAGHRSAAEQCHQREPGPGQHRARRPGQQRAAVRAAGRARRPATRGRAAPGRRPTTWWRCAWRIRASSTITGAEPIVTRVARLTEVSDTAVKYPAWNTAASSPVWAIRSQAARCRGSRPPVNHR